MYYYRHENKILKLTQSEYHESPRVDCENFGTMICSHRRYDLGDVQFNPREYSGWDGLKQKLYRDGAEIVLPLYLMDHSGLTIRTHPFEGVYGWFDSGQVGFIYVNKDKVRAEYGVKRISRKVFEKALRVLESEVKIYNTYLSGNIWDYTLYELNTETNEATETDSCSGFYESDFKTNGILGYVGEEFVNAVEMSKNEINEITFE